MNGLHFVPHGNYAVERGIGIEPMILCFAVNNPKLVAPTGVEPALYSLKGRVPKPIRRRRHGASEGNRTLISRLAI